MARFVAADFFLSTIDSPPNIPDFMSRSRGHSIAGPLKKAHDDANIIRTLTGKGMDENNAAGPDLDLTGTPEEYVAALEAFDATVCEACALSQAVGRRQAKPHAVYAANFFTRTCGHAVSMIRALPLSRWIRADFDHWDFGAVAGHARAILEGHLTFRYLAEEPESPEHWSAKLNVMHLNDCSRRLTLFRNLDDAEEVEGFEAQRAELQARLKNNAWFMALPEGLRKECLKGKYLTVASRDEMVLDSGWDPKKFNAYFDLLSQHTHTLTMSFYRMEPDGRGTGIENATDRGYMTTAMLVSTTSLVEQMEKLIEFFPDVAPARRGAASRFSPGPAVNAPEAQRERSPPAPAKRRKSKFRRK